MHVIEKLEMPAARVAQASQRSQLANGLVSGSQNQPKGTRESSARSLLSPLLTTQPCPTTKRREMQKKKNETRVFGFTNFGRCLLGCMIELGFRWNF
jgi:hypothetical protein